MEHHYQRAGATSLCLPHYCIESRDTYSTAVKVLESQACNLHLYIRPCMPEADLAARSGNQPAQQKACVHKLVVSGVGYHVVPFGR